jgi:hypothetical protein
MFSTYEIRGSINLFLSLIIESGIKHHNSNPLNHIDGVIVSVLASSVVDCGFEPCSGQTKDYEIGICCFTDKHTALRRKSKDCLAWNQDNVSEYGDMSI